MLSYTKSGINTFLTDLQLQDRTTAANPQMIREEGTRNNNTDQHSVSFTYEKTTGYSDNLQLSGNAGFIKEAGSSNRLTEVRDAGGALQSTNTNRSLFSNRSENSGMNLSFSRSDEYNPLKSFNFQLNPSKTIPAIKTMRRVYSTLSPTTVPIHLSCVVILPTTNRRGWAVP